MTQTPSLDTSTAEVRVRRGLDVPRSRRTLRIGVAGALLALIGALVALSVLRKRRVEGNTRYVTSAISRGDLEVTITATGTLQTLRTIQVGSEVSGRLQSVLVDANDRVKKGRLLAVIDPEQLRATVGEGQAQANEAAVAQARATLAESRAAAARARKQAAEGLAAQKDLESALAAAARAEGAVQSAPANVALSRAALTASRTRLDRATVVSPALARMRTICCWLGT